jgi:hypothetical protein
VERERTRSQKKEEKRRILYKGRRDYAIIKYPLALYMQ